MASSMLAPSSGWRRAAAVAAALVALGACKPSAPSDHPQAPAPADDGSDAPAAPPTDPGQDGAPAPAPADEDTAPSAEVPSAPEPVPQPGDPAPLPQVSPEDQALSRELNTEGYRLYKDGKYPEAIGKFEAAASADPTYALPPYNLACTLCLVRGGGSTCENDAYKDRILSNLERSVALDAARLERAKGDSDLECIRDTLGYQALLGYTPDDPQDVNHLLTHVSWYGPAPGAFGNMAGLTFKADGTLSLWMLDVTDEVKTLRYTGTWVSHGNRVEVRLDQAASGGSLKGFTAILTASGLETDSPIGSFTDMPSECSA